MTRAAVAIAPPLDAPRALVPVEDREFAVLAALVHAESGIVLSAAKKQLVQSRLGKHLRAHGLTRFADYVALIQENEGERARAIDALTTNHTKFFREQHHFDHLVADVWPALSARLAKGGRVRIWSAACSSGEEPYTLLMSLLGAERAAATRLGGQDFRLLATDLSPSVIATATAARYPTAALDEAPTALRQTWTRRAGEMLELDAALRALVSFRELNLLGPWPMRGQFDVIFCRNVMIYFDEPTKARLIARFADQLADGGTLYIGHSERVTGPATPILQPIGQTIYRKGRA